MKDYVKKIELDKLRYGKILIYTDADTDGSSIAALLINFFHRFWPELFNSNMVYRVETPIVVSQNVKSKKKINFYSQDEYNNWLTNESNTINTSGIVKYNYQSLSRRNVGIPSYFIGPNTALSDIYERGYIFNVDSSGQYSYTAQPYPNKFLVSAPYHFYFGLIKGESALDKFKTKYSVDE